MLIDVHGGQFKNKGAEMMLRTTLHELGQRIPDTKFVVDAYCGTYEDRCKLGLRQLFPPRAFYIGELSKKIRARMMLKASYKLAPQFKPYGCEFLDEIDGLVDISGLAFSDQWEDAVTQNFADLAHYYKSRNKPVILLPQALGPMERPAVRAAFVRILENSDVVYARDPRSYEYASALSERKDLVKLAPDITLFYPEKERGVVKPEQPPYVCLIPNIRMLDQGKQVWGEKYEKYILRVIKELQQHQVRVVLLVHDEAGRDLVFSKQIVETAGGDLEIIQERDPLGLKSIISKSLFVVGSRFHGLVAAFSSGVPAICMGWSHKYQALFKDFASEQFVISASTEVDEIDAMLRTLIDESRNREQRAQIVSKLEEKYAVNREMWENVARILSK